MKIGDKVRFLNATGGGRITAFEGKDLVLVCDEDGFEIPTLRTEIVVIDTNDYNFAKNDSPLSKEVEIPQVPAPTHSSIKALLNSHMREQQDATDEAMCESHETDLADMEMSFLARPLEKRGGDILNLYLAFLKQPHSTADKEFAAYVVNDSNYELQLFLTSNEELARQHLLFVAAIQPNTKTLVREFGKTGIADWEQISMQAIAYKREKAFVLKPAQQLQLRIEGRKFYKESTFKANDFFDTPALILELVRQDEAAETLQVDAQVLQTQLNGTTASQNYSHHQQDSPIVDRHGDTIVIDLHADKILDRPQGLSHHDLLSAQIRYFHQCMQRHRKNKGQKIVFIHGKGDGVLRAAVIKELKRDYRSCSFQDASFREYGFGATLVTIK